MFTAFQKPEGLINLDSNYSFVPASIRCSPVNASSPQLNGEALRELPNVHAATLNN
jgi:hypothetical protein